MASGRADIRRPDAQVGGRGKRGELKWSILQSQSSQNTVTCLLQLDHSSQSFPNSFTNGGQILKHMSLWGHSISKHHYHKSFQLFILFHPKKFI